jgi:hypothetical protein
MAPCDMGPGTLAHLGQLFGLLGEPTLLPLPQRGHHPAGLKKRRTQTLGQLPQRFPGRHRATLGHTLERARRHAMGVQGVGPRRGQGEVPALCLPIPRNQLAGGRHVRHPPLGCVEALPAGLPEACVRRPAAHRVKLVADICRHAPPVAPPASLSITTMVGRAARPEALGARRALGPEARALRTRRWRVRCAWLQAGGSVWGATGAALCRRGARTLTWSWLAPLVGLAGRLAGRPLLGRHGAADRLDQRRRPREEVRCVGRTEVRLPGGQPARRCLTGGGHALTGPTRQRLLPKRRPRGVIPAVGRVLQDEVVALGGQRPQAPPAGAGCIRGPGEVWGGPGLGPPGACLVAIPHARLLPLPVARLLGAIGGADQAVKARACQQETHQAPATRTDLAPDQGEGQDQARPAGEAGDTLAKRDDRGAFIEACVVRPPGLQGTAGALQDLRRVTLGEPRSWQGARALQQTRACEAIPALVALIVAS